MIREGGQTKIRLLLLVSELGLELAEETEALVLLCGRGLGSVLGLAVLGRWGLWDSRLSVLAWAGGFDVDAGGGCHPLRE